MRNTLTVMSALAVASSPAFALESATTGGSQATQATVGAINSKVDTSVAALQAQNNAMMKCMSQRKFYAPSDPKKDSDGCVGVGDYDLNMASGSNVNMVNGRVTGNNNADVGLSVGGGASNDWVSKIYGNGYGLYVQGTQQAFAAYNTGSTNWTAVIYGGASPYGLYIYNAANNAQLCLNGKCTTSLPSNGYYTFINAYYGGSMSRTNSSGRGVMVMSWYGLNPYCGGAGPNHTNLQGYVNGSIVAYEANASDDRSKIASITFYVPNGSTYAIYSQPYACGSGYFYVSEAVI
jgi:hypothetical protein